MYLPRVNLVVGTVERRHEVNKEEYLLFAAQSNHSNLKPSP